MLLVVLIWLIVCYGYCELFVIVVWLFLLKNRVVWLVILLLLFDVLVGGRVWVMERGNRFNSNNEDKCINN